MHLSFNVSDSPYANSVVLYKLALNFEFRFRDVSVRRLSVAARKHGAFFI